MSETMEIKDFLENQPPGAAVSVAVKWADAPTILILPAIDSYCDSEPCQRSQIFDPEPREAGPFHINKYTRQFFVYRCRNCRKTLRQLAMVCRREVTGTLHATKVGEVPTFGPHTSPQLVKLIGPDRELFLKGRRAESQGLGIGAFGYYRRVVEHQRTRLIDGLIEVAERTSSPSGTVKTLQDAKTETQFAKSIEMIKDAVPDAVKIDGHNPMTLLHAALSQGLHAENDETCLQLAQDIRVILAELADRIAQARKKQSHLQSALSRLMKTGE